MTVVSVLMAEVEEILFEYFSENFSQFLTAYWIVEKFWAILESVEIFSEMWRVLEVFYFVVQLVSNCRPRESSSCVVVASPVSARVTSSEATRSSSVPLPHPARTSPHPTSATLVTFPVGDLQVGQGRSARNRGAAFQRAAGCSRATSWVSGESVAASSWRLATFSGNC